MQAYQHEGIGDPVVPLPIFFFRIALTHPQVEQSVNNDFDGVSVDVLQPHNSGPLFFPPLIFPRLASATAITYDLLPNLV